MKFLVAVVWFAAYCTALAFGSAFFKFYFPRYNGSAKTNKKGFILLPIVLSAWFLFYVGVGLWATFLVMRFVWRRAGFKRKLPNWIAKVRCWPRGSTWFKLFITIVLMACAVGAFLLATTVIFFLFSSALSPETYEN
jgi:hypothetical protein